MQRVINIDGEDYGFVEGETVLDVAFRNNIDIPVLCYLKDIAETGACRVCLVEVKGVPVPVAACATFVTDDMVILTDTPEVRRHRLLALEFILLKHPLECGVCENSGDCQLQSIAKKLGVSEVKSAQLSERSPLMDWNMLWYNQDSCVLCQRCSKVCREVTGCNALEVTSRGTHTHMTPAGDDLICDYCGICVDVCPVGAIIDKPFRHSVKVWQLSNIHTACPFCPVGCKVNFGVYNGSIHRVRRSGDGYTCAKGRYGFKFIESMKRVKHPLININGEFHNAGWQQAFEAVYSNIVKYGPKNSLIVAGSRLTNEELYNYKSLAAKTGMRYLTEAEIYFGKFMRAYRDKFGHFESVGTLDDIESADLIFVIGTDFARECVGVKWRVLKAAVKNDSKIITIGLQRYEYDEHTYASIIADYADFACEFEKIKSGESGLYAAIKEYIAGASKVAIIVGNEYYCGEEDQLSVLSFADFIGEDKLTVMMPTNDKVNYTGALSMGGDTLEEIESLKPKVVFAMAVNPGLGKLEALGTIINDAEFYATPELFIADSVQYADVVFPVQASLESSGTYITLDGRLDRIHKVVNPPVGSKSNSEIANVIATLFRKRIESDHEAVFKNIADELGFSADDWSGDEDVFKRKTSRFDKTDYIYVAKEPKEKIVYVNPRHHEGVLTRILEADPADLALPLFPDVEVVIKPGVSRSEVISENIAKGVKLVPRGGVLRV